MRHELSQRGATSQQLPLSLWRSRSALVSVAGHAVAALLLLVSFVDGPPLLDEAPFITAEIVRLAAPVAPAATVGTPANPSRESSVDAPSESRMDSATTELAAPPPSPAVEAPDPLLQAPARETVANSAIEPASLTEFLSEPTTPNGSELVTEDVEPTEQPEPARTFEVAAPEREALERRLASWTGRLEAGTETLSWRENGAEYTAVLRQLGNSGPTSMEQLAVEVSTERDGERLVTELKMTRLAFSNFGQFVNFWDPNVGFYDDVIDGRFHSNTTFVVRRDRDKSPVFSGKVTVADRSIDTSGPRHSNRQQMFPGGLETRVRRIALPERAFTTTATPNSQLFEHDAAITFLADGRVQWREPGAPTGFVERNVGSEPFYIVAQDDVELSVSGTVNGKVLVYTPHHIVIAGDLYYASDPRESHADDYLGLVTDGIVAVAEPEVTGPGDLEIYASIYARRGFEVRRYVSRPSGTLRIHGSLTAGTLSATEPRYGTHIEFDNRLTTMRAPGFPLSDRYELDSASGEWRVVTTP